MTNNVTHWFYDNYLAMIRISAILLTLLLFNCKGSDREKTPSAAPLVSQLQQVESIPDVVLHKAALNGDLQTVMQQLNNRTKVDNLDAEDITALMLAAYNGHLEVVRYLIEKGADVNHVDVYKKTALIYAASGPFAETVELLLENNADPNMTDMPEHFTALMYAAAEGQLEVVKILLEYNADPLMKDVDEDMAVNFAERNGHAEVAELLRGYLK